MLKQKISIYLDTSVISALFDLRNPERRSLTLAFFKTVSNYDVFVSEITMTEIERTTELALRTKML